MNQKLLLPPTWSAYWLKEFPLLDSLFDDTRDSCVGWFSLSFSLIFMVSFVSIFKMMYAYIYKKKKKLRMWHLFYYAYAIGWPLFFRLLLWSIFPFLVHKVPRTKGSGFWLPVIQVVASFNLLLSIVVNKFFVSMSFIFCDNLKKNPNFSSSSALLQYQLSIALFSSLAILYLIFYSDVK